jgi:hypothetical protein
MRPSIERALVVALGLSRTTTGPMAIVDMGVEVIAASFPS